MVEDDGCVLTGACAQCLEDRIPRTGFVASHLLRFLAENQAMSKHSDFRGNSTAIYVSGQDLQCRKCVVEACRIADVERSLAWNAATTVNRAYDCTPEIEWSDRCDTNAVVGTLPTGSTNLEVGWRVVAVAGVDLRGESKEAVLAALASAALPVQVEFEQPSTAWAACVGCARAAPQSTYASGELRCEGCIKNFFQQADPEEVADSWGSD